MKARRHVIFSDLSAVKITGAATLPDEQFTFDWDEEIPVTVSPPQSSDSDNTDESDLEEFLLEAFNNFDPKDQDVLDVLS